MTPLWTLDAVAQATGGMAHGVASISGVTFDSREVRPGDLFVALEGATTDGHAFLGTAFANGAAAALVRHGTALDAPHVAAPDTMAALNALGLAARERASAARICGVTGSAGKTSTKEALRQCLERYRPGLTLASVKSYNNHTGVPLSLARMPADVRFGVFEMGMNHAGELTALSRLVRPHVAIVTTISSAHVAFFPDGEAGIARAKAEIFSGLEPGGTAILNAEAPHFDILLAAARAVGAEIVTFGLEQGDVHVQRIARHPTCTTLTADVRGELLTCKIGLPGDHWVSNGLAVLAAVQALGGDLGLAGLALAEMEGLEGRGKRSVVALPAGGDLLVLDESYNANPASMAAALAVLGGFECAGRGRRIAVLGPMRELGDKSTALHAALAEPIEAAGVDIVLLVGDEMSPLVSALPARVQTVRVEDAAAALDWLRDHVRADDIALVKASNSVGLSRVVKGLKALGRAGEKENALC